MLTAEHVTKAMGTTPWDLGNQVLYDLCRQYPGHTDEQAVIAKIWLIGRTYAAAIERRRTKSELTGDRFYLEGDPSRVFNGQVVRRVLRSSLVSQF